MRRAECEHCKSWVRYDASRFECARALGGFDCAFESRDGWKPKTYEDLEKENAKAKEIIKMVIDSYNQKERFSFEKDLIKAEQFLKERGVEK